MREELRENLEKVREAMYAYEDSERRIQHFMKVRGFAKQIGEQEKLPEHQLYILEMAALVHDIGIKLALENYGSSAGKYQEFEGPGVAGEMLTQLGIDDDVVDRVCWLVGHHHTYRDVEQKDHRILLEADALVNADEEDWTPEATRAFLENVFETDEGIRLYKDIYKEKLEMA